MWPENCCQKSSGEPDYCSWPPDLQSCLWKFIYEPKIVYAIKDHHVANKPSVLSLPWVTVTICVIFSDIASFPIFLHHSSRMRPCRSCHTWAAASPAAAKKVSSASFLSCLFSPTKTERISICGVKVPCSPSYLQYFLTTFQDTLTFVHSHQR